jgi:hypothetical protein
MAGAHRKDAHQAKDDEFHIGSFVRTSSFHFYMICSCHNTLQRTMEATNLPSSNPGGHQAASLRQHLSQMLFFSCCRIWQAAFDIITGKAASEYDNGKRRWDTVCRSFPGLWRFFGYFRIIIPWSDVILHENCEVRSFGLPFSASLCFLS